MVAASLKHDVPESLATEGGVTDVERLGRVLRRYFWCNIFLPVVQWSAIESDRIR
jgi:hypothetical protein